MQENGLLLLPLALGHLPVISFPSLPLTTTRQCSLEESNKDVDNVATTTESMTVFLWISSQWYAQRLMPYKYVIITLQMKGKVIKMDITINNCHFKDSSCDMFYLSGVDQIGEAWGSSLANRERLTCSMLPQLWREGPPAAGLWGSG